jgi:hypothetical protein
MDSALNSSVSRPCNKNQVLESEIRNNVYTAAVIIPIICKVPVFIHMWLLYTFHSLQLLIRTSIEHGNEYVKLPKERYGLTFRTSQAHDYILCETQLNKQG